VEMCAFFFTKERFSSSIHEPPSTSLYRGGGGVHRDDSWGVASLFRWIDDDR
jgi:hypothetical protein